MPPLLENWQGSGTCGTNGHKVITTLRLSAFPSPKASKKEWLAIIYFGNPEIAEYKENRDPYLKTINRKQK